MSAIGKNYVCVACHRELPSKMFYTKGSGNRRKTCTDCNPGSTGRGKYDRSHLVGVPRQLKPNPNAVASDGIHGRIDEPRPFDGYHAPGTVAQCECGEVVRNVPSYVLELGLPVKCSKCYGGSTVRKAGMVRDIQGVKVA
jgi:hypothetical protein